MQPKSLGIAAMAVVSLPLGVAYLARTTLGSRESLAYYLVGGFVGVVVNILFCAGAELGVHSIKKPYPKTVYSTTEITLRYDTESNVLPRQTSDLELIASLATSYGIVVSFFRDRTYPPFTELSVTPSPDYVCQWRMDGHVPLETILEAQQYRHSNPDILLGSSVKATDTHIVDYARETCRAVLAKE